MSDETVRFDEFRALVAQLAVSELGAPAWVPDAMWQEAQPFTAQVQFPDEVVTFHRSVTWRGHVVRLAWSDRTRGIVFYYVDRDNPGGPPPPGFLDDSGQPLGVRVRSEGLGMQGSGR